ncbi:hypothetical protein BSKO_09311 [Bryopsis sp. KO-2023]|nr:hypothetical protein BSKO_09311 [Bryopsis sp. KO-2023]
MESQKNLSFVMRSLRKVQSVGVYFRDRENLDSKLLLYECIAEFYGTMMIVLFGVGSVNTAVAVGAHTDLWHIAMIWGFGVGLAIYCTASVSGAHLNPAVSFAFALVKPSKFKRHKLGWFWAAQMAGGIAGGAINLLIFHPYIERFEKNLKPEGFSRDSSGGVHSAMVFGEYFPDPGWVRANIKDGEDWESLDGVISPFKACCIEAWGTAILMFVILALTDDKQKIVKNKEMIPFLIGFTVAVLIALYAPLTQAGWNPARDFGPRVAAAMAGWGTEAIPGPRNGFWVYIIGPMVGAPLGALAYTTTIEPGLKLVDERSRAK